MFMENRENEYGKKNPFTVPAGYFESLNDRLMARVREKRVKPKTDWLRVMRPYFGLTGVFVLAMVVLHWVLPSVFTAEKRGEADPVEAYWHSVVEEQDIEFDEDFNPTKDEIIEYLSQEMDASDFYWIAGKF